MDSVIVSDYGVMLAKTGERLVVRGPKPRLELIEGGRNSFCPSDRVNGRPPSTVVTSEGREASGTAAAPASRQRRGVRPPKGRPIRSRCHCSASAKSLSPPRRLDLH